MATREQYIEAAGPGNIVAFKINESLLSGKIISVDNEKSNPFVIKTNNGSIYFANSEDIVWVKNSSKWPVGIYNALKYSSR